MVHNLGFVYTISADDMLCILPEHHIDDKSLRIIRKELKEQGALVGKRWKGFAQDPAQQPPHEDEVFSAFPELFSSVAKACLTKVPGLDQVRQQLRNSPFTTPLSLRVTTSKPDGNMYRQPERCRVMLGMRETDRWEDAAVTLEYTKENEITQRSDVSQPSSTLFQCADPVTIYRTTGKLSGVCIISHVQIPVGDLSLE
ncbi:hypothetical protein BV25DRAFT_1920220 [Artomyces pyxidatus]|uniref:Uncharacterized protein n=1 Tax=Artomyces pyxidatus TaxID=48021 RepID=A0ACB8SMD9_9AGAM|nr:hypothetical protein BV25DRAFT_1920220 [Artomyces pyxidatus]